MCGIGNHNVSNIKTRNTAVDCAGSSFSSLLPCRSIAAMDDGIHAYIRSGSMAAREGKMRITWVVGLLLLFLVGTLISITLEGEYIGTDTTNVFYKLMRPDFGQFTNPLSAIGGFFLLVWDWLQAFWSVFWWDYSFFVGTWAILKYVGWCISIGIVVSLVLAIRGTSSS